MSQVTLTARKIEIYLFCVERDKIIRCLIQCIVV